MTGSPLLDTATAGARRSPDAWKTRAAASGLVVALFIASIVMLHRDFGGSSGMVAQDMTPAVVDARPVLLLQLAMLGVLAAFLLSLVWRDAVPAVRPSRRVCWTLVALAVLLSFVAVWALRAFPNSGDEYNYLFESDTFLHGRIWNPLLPGQDLMWFNWILQKDGKWVSQYPPGWPLLLAAWHLPRLPYAALNPLLGGILLFLLARFCRRQEGEDVAVIAISVAAFSSFFLFNAASYFDHIPAALFGVLFCLWGARFLAEPGLEIAILTGAALGGVGLTRPFDVMFFALPFAASCLIHGRVQHYRCGYGILLGGFPFLAFLMLDNQSITGHPFLSPYVWGFPSLKLGWPSVSEMGTTTNAVQEWHMLHTRLVMLAEWTSPLLAFCYLPALLWRLAPSRLRFYDLIFPLNIGAYLLFPDYGGNQYGPRYFFDSFPLAAVTLAAAAASLLANRRRPRAAGFTAGLGVAHLTICCAGFILLLPMMRAVIDQRMDVYDQANAMRLNNAVVILRSSTGVILPMFPPDLTRNGLTRDGRVVYVHDIPQLLPELRRMFPGRSFFMYVRRPDQPHGKLIPLPASAGR